MKRGLLDRHPFREAVERGAETGCGFPGLKGHPCVLQELSLEGFGRQVNLITECLKRHRPAAFPQDSFRGGSEHGIRGEREGIRGGCRSMEETQYQAAHLLLDGRRIGVPEELRDQIPEEIRHFHRADRTGNPF